MRTLRLIRTFHDKFPWLGPVIWVLTVQYFVAQVVAALSFRGGYNWRLDSISDLGNTACGPFGGHYVCSPLHPLVNLSFIALGLAMALGSLLIYEEFKRDWASLAGFLCLALGGIGSMLVGFFPENSVQYAHDIGAALPFFVGNIGLLILGAKLNLPRWLRAYTLLTGAFSLAALGLLATGTYLGIQNGGMEKAVAYPQTLWLIIFGLYMTKNHFISTRL